MYRSVLSSACYSSIYGLLSQSRVHECIENRSIASTPPYLDDVSYTCLLWKHVCLALNIFEYVGCCTKLRFCRHINNIIGVMWLLSSDCWVGSGHIISWRVSQMFTRFPYRNGHFWTVINWFLSLSHKCYSGRFKPMHTHPSNQLY